MSQGFLSLDQVKYFVLDEADRMLDMGFIHDIKRILPKLPKEKQTLFFSATMPDSIVTLASALLKNPVKITITPESPTVDAIEQFVYFVEKAEKGRLLISLLRKAENQSVLVFSRTKHNADRIVRVLGKAGIGSQAIHGNKSQAARQSALGNFKSGKTRVMSQRAELMWMMWRLFSIMICLRMTSIMYIASDGPEGLGMQERPLHFVLRKNEN